MSIINKSNNILIRCIIIGLLSITFYCILQEREALELLSLRYRYTPDDLSRATAWLLLDLIMYNVERNWMNK